MIFFKLLFKTLQPAIKATMLGKRLINSKLLFFIATFEQITKKLFKSIIIKRTFKLKLKFSTL